jgi:hypothetical protein
MGTTRFKAAIAVVVAVAFVTTVVGIAKASTVTFDFEDQAATAIPISGVRTGALTSLTYTLSGLTLQITRPGGKFDIVQDILGQAKPVSWGAKSLDPFAQAMQATTFVVNFSLPVDSVSIMMGDYGDDPNDALILKAFSGLNASGTALASATDTLPLGGTNFDYRTLTVSVAGINSISFIGGTQYFPNSVFYDNITVTFTGDGGTTGEEPPGNIPEPSALTLVAIGLTGLLTVARRKT